LLNDIPEIGSLEEIPSIFQAQIRNVGSTSNIMLDVVSKESASTAFNHEAKSFEMFFLCGCEEKKIKDLDSKTNCTSGYVPACVQYMFPSNLEEM